MLLHSGLECKVFWPEVEKKVNIMSPTTGCGGAAAAGPVVLRLRAEAGVAAAGCGGAAAAGCSGAAAAGCGGAAAAGCSGAAPAGCGGAAAAGLRLRAAGCGLRRGCSCGAAGLRAAAGLQRRCSMMMTAAKPMQAKTFVMGPSMHEKTISTIDRRTADQRGVR